MKMPFKNCKQILSISKVQILNKILNKLEYEKLKKNKYAETWSSSTDQSIACKILDIIGIEALQQINNNLKTLDECLNNGNHFKISCFTVTRMRGIVAGIAWHKDSYYDERINKFIGIEPYGYKAYISLSESTGLETVFAPFINSNINIRGILKSLFITINPFFKKYSERLGLGDVLIFRTDVMHKRPWCIFKARDAIIISYVRSNTDLELYKSDAIIQKYYSEMLCF